MSIHSFVYMCLVHIGILCAVFILWIYFMKNKCGASGRDRKSSIQNPWSWAHDNSQVLRQTERVRWNNRQRYEDYFVGRCWETTIHVYNSVLHEYQIWFTTYLQLKNLPHPTQQTQQQRQPEDDLKRSRKEKESVDAVVTSSQAIQSQPTPPPAPSTLSSSTSTTPPSTSIGHWTTAKKGKANSVPFTSLDIAPTTPTT